MNLTQEELIKLKAWATITGNLDDYVFLKEDEKGRYIEYAFQDGAPHDNRCLSWYDKLQPNALARNKHQVDTWMIHPTGQIYRLSAIDCGHSGKEGDDHCSPGHPCFYCKETRARHWTYEEPVKCACWILESITPDDIKHLKILAEGARKFTEVYDELKQESETENQ